MLDKHTAIGWRGYELVDRDGDKIGSISDIYLDRESNQPEWATVKTGLFGLRHTFVPIRNATSEGDIVRIPFEKDHVKDAPNVDPGEELSQAEERELYEHYGVDYSEGRSSNEDRSPSPEEGERGVAVPGQTDDEAEAAADPGRDRLERGTITERISEEPAGQGAGDALRLKRYVVTEEVRVPVQREELRIERNE